MNKRYQIFISSTFLDLKEERQKVMNAILELEQFPAGMELFEASNESQWSIISDTIDVSDYYVLIIRWKYGSVFSDGPYKGISYTEREYEYAVSRGVPVLAFIISDDVAHTNALGETDPEKAGGLWRFIQKVKSRQLVKYWRTADDLANKVTLALAKAMKRGNRPGWIRSTEFDVDKTLAEIVRLTDRVHKLEELNNDLMLKHHRKPSLRLEVCPGINRDGIYVDDIEIINGEATEDLGESKETNNNIASVTRLHVAAVDMKGAEEGINYKDVFGGKVHVAAKEVRLFRYLCKNVFLIGVKVFNDGDAPATGVRIKMEFPNDLLTVSEEELEEYLRPDVSFKREKDFQSWNLKFFSPDAPETDNVSVTNEVKKASGIKSSMNDKFIGLDELSEIDDIAELLDPAYINERVEIFPGEVDLQIKRVGHKGMERFDGLYVLPTKPGEFTVNCKIICNEYPDVVIQPLQFVVD